jgi:integral membrane protein
VRLFWTYRVLALVVGVLLVVGTANATLKYGHFLNIPGLEAGSTLHQFGHDTDWVWLPHGWVYIIYLIVAFVLTQKANWTLPQFGDMLLVRAPPALEFPIARLRRVVMP